MLTTIQENLSDILPPIVYSWTLFVFRVSFCLVVCLLCVSYPHEFVSHNKVRNIF